MANVAAVLMLYCLTRPGLLFKKIPYDYFFYYFVGRNRKKRNIFSDVGINMGYLFLLVLLDVICIIEKTQGVT